MLKIKNYSYSKPIRIKKESNLKITNINTGKTPIDLIEAMKKGYNSNTQEPFEGAYKINSLKGGSHITPRTSSRIEKKT